MNMSLLDKHNNLKKKKQKNLKKIFFFLIFLAFVQIVKSKGDLKFEVENFKVIQLAGNTYLTQKTINGTEKIENNGIKNWNSTNAIFSTYFRLGKKGNLKLYLQYDAAENSVVKVSLCKKFFLVNLSKGKNMKIFVGNINEVDTGYVRVDMKGIRKTGATFAEIKSLILEGTSVSEKICYVDDFSFYWGRSGAAVHLHYPLPENEKIEWFYNELMVPVGYDPDGSYFMANGFSQGYLGMQVNSLSERKITFYVWSPSKIDNSNEITDSQKTKLLKKGTNVYVGEFGNKGTGMQGYLIYPWKTGNTYKFLTRIKPNGNGSTEYTAYFYAPEENKWFLIASFLRPLTDTYCKGVHSFLQNLNPENGYLDRKVILSNQWFRSVDGCWFCIEKDVRFTADETARKGARMDYKGGIENGKFFLQNGGFFNDYTSFGTTFPSLMQNYIPLINFNELDKD